MESFLESAQQLWSYAEERQKGKESQSKRIEPMETGHNPRITPGTHSLLGGQGCRVFRKIAHRLFYSARESNPGFLGCEPSVLPLHHEGPQVTVTERKEVQRTGVVTCTKKR